MKKLIYLLFFLFLINNAFSYTIDWNVVPNECKLQVLNETKYDEFIQTNNLRDVVEAITNDIVDSNFSGDYYYNVWDVSSTINFDLFFLAGVYPENINYYGIYFTDWDYAGIYVEHIYNDYINESWTYDEFIDQVYITTLHEIGHYLDLGYTGFVNESYTFNIEGDRVNVTNQQYFIDIFDLTFNGSNPINNSIFSSDVNFTSVFQVYNSTDYYDEIVTRINSVCLENLVGINFNYSTNYDYCNEFNFYQEDANNFNIINEIVMKSFVRESVENGWEYGLLLNQEYCGDYLYSPVERVLRSTGNGLNSFLTSISQPLVYYMFAMGFAFVIIGLFRQFRHLIP